MSWAFICRLSLHMQWRHAWQGQGSGLRSNRYAGHIPCKPLTGHYSGCTRCSRVLPYVRMAGALPDFITNSHVTNSRSRADGFRFSGFVRGRSGPSASAAVQRRRSASRTVVTSASGRSCLAARTGSAIARRFRASDGCGWVVQSLIFFQSAAPASRMSSRWRTMPQAAATHVSALAHELRDSDLSSSFLNHFPAVAATRGR